VYFTPNVLASGPSGPFTWFGTLAENGAGSTGLLYKRNRYFAPVSGRFTQADPIGLGGGLNLYGFADGDPVNFSDPFGLCPMCIAAWGAYEIGSGLYDAFNAVKTVRDQDATIGEKASTVALAAISLVAPGGGYTAGAKGGTYILRSTEGTVMRTGRTNNLLRREREHGRDAILKNFAFEVDKVTDNYAAQRGREQILHDLFNPPLNRVNPISARNPRKEAYLDAGRKLP
jgi:RHS repeat-associated protein